MRIVAPLEIGLTIIGVLLLGALLTECNQLRQASKVADAKANLHNIQLSIERYAVDRVQYPAWLIGGTAGAAKLVPQGGIEPRDHAEISDPLIREKYVISYDKNPFVPAGSKEADTLLKLQESLHDPMRPSDFGDKNGYRFGADGTIIGNVMADLRFTKWTPAFTGQSSSIVPAKLIPTDADVNFHQYDLYPEGKPVKPVLPGQFIYKPWGLVLVRDRTGIIRSNSRTAEEEIPLPVKLDRYILGLMGPAGVRGADILGPEFFWQDKEISIDGTTRIRIHRSYLGQENEEPFNGSPIGDVQIKLADGGVFMGNTNGIPDGIILILNSGEDIRYKR